MLFLYETQGGGVVATVEEFVEQYKTDKALQDEVAALLAGGRVTVRELLAFAKKHDVDVSIADLPKYIRQAKQLGLIK